MTILDFQSFSVTCLSSSFSCFSFYHFSAFRWCVDNALIKGEIEEREYFILPVMSELSTVRCDRALGLWIAGTRASSVDGELPWTVRWKAVKGSRDRSSDRAAAVASTPGSRAQAATEGGFLGLRHKTKEADGGRTCQVVEARASVSGLTEATGVDGI